MTCLLLALLAPMAHSADLEPSWIRVDQLDAHSTAPPPVQLRTPQGVRFASVWSRAPLGDGILLMRPEADLAGVHLPTPASSQLVVVDADADGFDEILSLEALGVRHLDPLTGATLAYVQIAGGDKLLAGDVDADGTLEILVQADRQLFRLDLATGQLEATLRLSYDTAALALAQVDGDAQLELLLSGRVVLAADTFQVEPLIGVDDPVHLIVSDLDHDGDDDLVFYEDWTWWRLDVASGASEWASPGVYGSEDGRPVLADADGDGQQELVFTRYGQGQFLGILLALDVNTGAAVSALPGPDAWFPWDGAEQPQLFGTIDLDGDGVEEIWARLRFGARWYHDPARAHFESAEVPGLGTGESATALGDLDGDGQAEILIASATEGILVVDAASGRLLARSLPFNSRTPEAVQLVDTDGDGRVELLAAGSEPTLFTWDGGPTVEVQAILSGLPNLLGALVVAVDANLDGRDDLVVGTPAGQVLLWDAVSSSVQWEVRVPGLTDLELGQVDGDSELDIVCASSLGMGVLDLLTGRLDASAAGAWEHVAVSEIGGPGTGVLALPDDPASALQRLALSATGWRASPLAAQPGITAFRGLAGGLVWTDGSGLHLLPSVGGPRLDVAGLRPDLRASVVLDGGDVIALQRGLLGVWQASQP